jgi:Helicase associated domain
LGPNDFSPVKVIIGHFYPERDVFVGAKKSVTRTQHEQLATISVKILSPTTMWSVERLRRENLAIQTAIRNQLITGSASNFPAAVTEHTNLGIRNFSASPPFDVETLLTLHSQNALNQHHQSQQLAAIHASLLTHRAGLSTTSTADLRNEVTAALCHPQFSEMNGTKTNATLPNCSRLIQLANTINSSLVQGSHFGQDTSHRDLWSSLHLSSTKQAVLNMTRTSSIPQDHSTREMKKARAASFAPVRKKSKDSGAKPSSENKCVDVNDVFLEMENKPSKNFTKWQAMLESLKKFKESHGHCIVPRGYEDMKLASWVSHFNFLAVLMTFVY